MATLPFKEWFPSSKQDNQIKDSYQSSHCRSSHETVMREAELPYDFSKSSSIISEDEKNARIRLYRSQNVGPITYRNLLRRYKTAQTAIERLPQLALKGGRRSPLEVKTLESIEKEKELHKKIGAHLIVEGDGIYPSHLMNNEDIPPVLSVRGRVELLKTHCVAIVGARNCSLNGKKMARTIASEVGQAGFTIISGLARGIDAEAHKASLETGTIAVIAGGIDKIYPPENKELFQDILEQGLIIAESPLGSEPQSNLFPKRNRLISALSQGVVVIEAAQKSGSMVTARYAQEQGRELFVVPGSPMDPRYRGSNQLIRSAAHLVCEPNDVIHVLKEPIAQKMREARQDSHYHVDSYEDENHGDHTLYVADDDQNSFLNEQDNLTQPQNQNDLQKSDHIADFILQNLDTAPILLDDLMSACPYTITEVMTVLLELELAGRITRHPGNKLSL